MAISSRFRSGLPLFQRILRAESTLPQISAVGNPGLDGSRNFSTQAKAANADVKVPLSFILGSGRYASALFLSAAKANELDKVAQEIVDIVEVSKRSPFFSQFIKDLSLIRETRVKAITEMFSEAGLSDITKNFLVNSSYEYVVYLYCFALFYQPLPAEEEKELQQTLKEILPNAKSVQVEQKIDTSIMGGLVIEFGDKVFDMSIKTRAKQMEKFLRDPINFDKI
ncbi:uncharacterized protein A4U43_C01F28000 [Asparagus officinalis]|uniref:ATP synthase subunit O, mitochondrial n=1 Tax=Asparagus officinalis TaxID=4686 RepID=A0A5P1FTB8_ASPOF|nr:uncharacterized protein A4U43_C01F28000 [Asparagus officinalis]